MTEDRSIFNSFPKPPPNGEPTNQSNIYIGGCAKLIGDHEEFNPGLNVTPQRTVDLSVATERSLIKNGSGMMRIDKRVADNNTKLCRYSHGTPRERRRDLIPEQTGNVKTNDQTLHSLRDRILSTGDKKQTIPERCLTASSSIPRTPGDIEREC